MQRFGSQPGRFPIRHPLQLLQVANPVISGNIGVQSITAWTVTHPFKETSIVTWRLPQHAHRSQCRTKLARNEIEQRRLARTVWTKQPIRSRSKLEREVV